MREFWIDPKEHSGHCGRPSYGRHTAWSLEKSARPSFIHVVEKSAYDDLERKSRELCVQNGNLLMEIESLKRTVNTLEDFADTVLT
jgi:hypothetical protein